MLEALGYTAEEVVGRDYLTTFVPPDDRPALLEVFQSVVEEGRTIRHENRVLTRDGKELLVEWHGRAVLKGDGRLDYVFGVGVNITERRSIEEQLRQAQKMEAVGRLAGGIAHDFNNQLTIVKGYSDLLLLGPGLDEDVRGSLKEIQSAAQRATLLTSRLLAFGRKQILRPEVIGLNDVITRMAEPLARMIGEDIRLEILPGAGLGSVRADPGQVEQALVNLAVNARDAMPEGGCLTGETANVNFEGDAVPAEADAPSGPHVLLAVRDTGTGMDEATREQIFEPFFTTKPVGQGTGLGLPMVYGFVKQSGGHICVASEAGKGATFTIYLPRVDTPAEAPAEAIDTKADARGDETVLVAEDDRSVRQLLVRVLRRLGYTVLEAACADEALPLSEGHDGPIHLLIADVVMPGMSGPKLAKRLRAARPEMRVLYISGYAEPALGAPDDGRLASFLHKPFETQALVRKVRHVLDDKRPS
jgi:PAS domain S-box-containing protein